MTEIYSTAGFATTIQSFDETGIVIMGCELGDTNDSLLVGISIFDEYNNQIPVETIQDRLAAIHERSHARFSEAWRRLAQM
jgi:hypothetical protein